MADRHQFRADWHDYNTGIYFVTICCKDRLYHFGHIDNGRMRLSEIGVIADDQIKKLTSHYQDVELRNYVVMPNHIHMVISVGTLFKASGTTLPAIDNFGGIIPSVGVDALKSIPTAPVPPASCGCLKPKMHGDASDDFHHNSALSIIIRCFKGGVKRECRKIGLDFAWQSRYHEHIIRNQRAYDNIMNYIDNNVFNWDKDCFNPSRE